MTKYQTFFNKLLNTVDTLDTTDVKSSIGDSVNNNRVLTVNQVIRFLESGSRGSKLLSKNLSAVYDILREDIVATRPSNRTDAIDINEFINFYELTVLGSGEYRSVVGRTVSL